MYVGFLPLQISTKKALDLEASAASNAEILCDSYVPTRYTVSILEKIIGLRSLQSRVVCAGIAKLVVFYRIKYGMRSPSTSAISERISWNIQRAKSNNPSEIENGDTDTTCTHPNPPS